MTEEFGIELCRPNGESITAFSGKAEKYHENVQKSRCSGCDSNRSVECGC
jgi:hypothetical protein